MGSKDRTSEFHPILGKELIRKQTIFSGLPETKKNHFNKFIPAGKTIMRGSTGLTKRGVGIAGRSKLQRYGLACNQLSSLMVSPVEPRMKAIAFNVHSIGITSTDCLPS